MNNTTKFNIETKNKLLNSLSPRESEVLSQIIRGCRNKEIAGNLFISIKTVEFHIRNIFIKARVRNRLELINLVLCNEPLDWRKN